MTNRRHFVLSASTSLFKFSAPEVVIELDRPPAPRTKRYRELSAFIAKIRKKTPPMNRIPCDPLYRLEEQVCGLIANPTAHCFSAQVDRMNACDSLLAAERALREIVRAIEATGLFGAEQEAFADYAFADRGMPKLPPTAIPDNERRIASYLLDGQAIMGALHTCAEIGQSLASTDIRQKLILTARSFVVAHLYQFYPVLSAGGSDKRVHIVLDNAWPGQFKYKVLDRAVADPFGSDGRDSVLGDVLDAQVPEAAE